MSYPVLASEIELFCGLTTNPLPSPRKRTSDIAHAPFRNCDLTTQERKNALFNALRYFPPSTHAELAPEFAKELVDYGHIYMYRFLPNVPIKAYPISDLPCKHQHGSAIAHMILNNLDPKVAQFPEELVTYGGNGQVFSNWAQFWIVMYYLSIMNDDQTLVMYSGHPLGLFESNSSSPRVVVTNGMEKYLGLESLKGKVFLTSGLGGMSGAQAKAAVICDCVGITAEVSYEALYKRYEQGWVTEIIDADLDKLVARVRQARKNKETTAIGYHGNVVDIWEKFVNIYEETGEMLVDLGSDQTSCHNPFNGGYYPVQLGFEESQLVLKQEPKKFASLVQESLRRQIKAINTLADAGLFSGTMENAFLLECRRAGANIDPKESGASPLAFRYPSYVQDIMGDIFSLGFGPFRWVCSSGDPSDLVETDKLATEVILDIMKEGIPASIAQQYRDNLKWLREAEEHKMVVGSQARILYSDQKGRVEIALAFNHAVSIGRVSAPIIISRDHHDVSGTDSPFRETSNITDGSAFTADMAVQNCIGDSFRGATWVSLHNGGGCGWGEVINGGFGLVLDGTMEAHVKAKSMLNWDVFKWCCKKIMECVREGKWAPYFLLE
ncbi:hutU [Lepeophtheirus salmonis]|uniref:HutU n=1 Tax=Lepeophtheirus salmonis TaxID=72036 RepID=A0A7R8CND4_LEPSM|nr:hutU [Lepeophtheirus salmonis]CAF2828804.1 hutU [Lepeophtheirus salmonis]